MAEILDIGVDRDLMVIERASNVYGSRLHELVPGDVIGLAHHRRLASVAGVVVDIEIVGFLPEMNGVEAECIFRRPGDTKFCERVPARWIAEAWVADMVGCTS